MLITSDSLDSHVGLYFVVKGELLLHACTLAEGEHYGDFINFPESHDDVWRQRYYRKYRVDFDYFPRGRIIYNSVENRYLIYYDKCIRAEAEALAARYPEGKCTIGLDEHYRCRKCSRGYVI